MQVHYSSTTAQTLVPIVIDVTNTAAEPAIAVTSRVSQPRGTFTLPVKASGDTSYQTQFWLEQPGDYTLTVQAGSQTQTQTLHITAHRFLPFGVEFGLFLLTLLAAFWGVYWWHRKKIA